MTETNHAAIGADAWTDQQYLEQLAAHYADSPVPEIRAHKDRLLSIAADLASAAQPAAQGDALDAARYRWLRDGCDTKGSAASRIASDCYGLEWDKLIDAARAKEGAPHEQ